MTKTTNRPRITPGEWNIDAGKPAKVRAYEEGTDNYVEVADCGLNQHPEARANALLIAAAPDLLGLAMEELAAHLAYAGLDENKLKLVEKRVARIRRVIAKAEGGA